MHVRRTLALALAVPLLLAGCSEDPEPRPKMPDPTPTSSEPSPTESESAKAESPEDFIRRWSDALREMQATGETAEFRALGPRCASCNSTADRVEQIYQAGGAIEWDGWDIVRVSARGDSDTDFVVLENSAPTRFRESKRAPWQTLNGGRTRHLVELERAGDSWVIARTAELAG